MNLPRFLFCLLACSLIAISTQAQPGVGMQRYVESLNSETVQDLSKATERPGCSGCMDIAGRLDRTLTAHQTFKEDLARAFDAYAIGPDSLLLGRLDLASLQLALSDFTGITKQLIPSAAIAATDMTYRPGLYRRLELGLIRSEQQMVAAMVLQQALRALTRDLASSIPQPVLIAPQSLNVLYTGLDNPVRVFAGGADPASVVLEGPGVRKGEEAGIWIVKPESPGNTILRVRGTAPGGQLIRGEATFSARRVPEPDVYVGGRADGVLVKSSITAQSGIAARHDDFLLDAGYSIRGFELVYTPEYGSPVASKTPGNKFTPEMMTILNRTKPGDRLIFRVAVQWPDGSIKTLSPLFYVR